MICAHCDAETTVYRSKARGRSVERFRQCLGPERHRFATAEVARPTVPVVLTPKGKTAALALAPLAVALHRAAVRLASEEMIRLARDVTENEKDH